MFDAHCKVLDEHDLGALIKNVAPQQRQDFDNLSAQMKRNIKSCKMFDQKELRICEIVPMMALPVP